MDGPSPLRAWCFHNGEEGERYALPFFNLKDAHGSHIQQVASPGMHDADEHIVAPGTAYDRPHAMHVSGERSEEHTSELQSPDHLVCRLLLEKKKKTTTKSITQLTIDQDTLSAHVI